MTTNPYLPVFELTRGEVVESIHYGAIAISDNCGRLAAWYGSPDAVTYLRSSAKPFQALPFMESGGQEAFQLSPAEVALMCASHSGTDEHVATVRSIQDKTGVSENELLCGTHPAFHGPTAESMRQRGERPTPNRHNCSGKHTGMLAYTRLNNVKTEAGQPELEYINTSHPLQKNIVQAFADMCELPIEQVEVGIDGCSAPNFAVPLRNAALAFAKLADPSGLSPSRAEACRKITYAMIHHPDMVGGPDSFDTHVMEVMEGRVVCKGGAEGYLAMSLMPGALGSGSPALGITLKVSDGDLGSHWRARADYLGHVRPAVALEVLRQLGAISEQEVEQLSAFGPKFPVQNWRKLLVGEGRPVFILNKASFSD
jgi:L-asparaginase II